MDIFQASVAMLTVSFVSLSLGKSALEWQYFKELARHVEFGLDSYEFCTNKQVCLKSYILFADLNEHLKRRQLQSWQAENDEILKRKKSHHSAGLVCNVEYFGEVWLKTW